MKVRSHLAVMAIVILVPVTTLWGLALKVLLDEQRRSARDELTVSARMIALAVDRELAVAETSLRVLALSSHLANGDLSAFHSQALVARTSDTAWILLFDADAQQLVNTRFPPGTPLARRANPERVTHVLRSRQPSVSDLYVGVLTRRPIVTVDMPVELADGRRYVLAQSFFPEYFERTLAERSLQPGWRARLVDRTGAAIFESGDVPAPDTDLFQATAPVSGRGWSVTLAVPVVLLEGPGERAVGVAGMGVLGALFAAFLIAIALGRNLARAISSVAESAAAIGRRPIPVLGAASRIDEIDGLRRTLALVQAERERLLESEKAARNLAEARNEAKDDFLAMLAHELRNPLAAISGAAMVIGRMGALPQAVTRARDIIHRQTEHLKRLVEDLIEARRLMTGKARLMPQRLDLAAAAQDCIAALEMAGRTRGHEITLVATPAWVEADPTRLDQVINNLLGNAIKYTRPPGHIEVTVGIQEGHAVLAVRDDGAGMSPELIARVFEPFVQGASTDAPEAGLGVGLAVVRQLADMHGGSVAAFSDGLGRGSVFKVRLPLANADAIEPALPAKRVLLAGEHEESRRAIRELLEGHGCAVFEAATGEEALRLADRQQPDLALVDVELTDPDGCEVARVLTGSKSTRHIPIIALTADVLQGTLNWLVDCGFHGHLEKPVEPSRLFELLGKGARA